MNPHPGVRLGELALMWAATRRAVKDGDFAQVTFHVKERVLYANDPQCLNHHDLPLAITLSLEAIVRIPNTRPGAEAAGSTSHGGRKGQLGLPKDINWEDAVPFQTGNANTAR